MDMLLSEILANLYFKSITNILSIFDIFMSYCDEGSDIFSSIYNKEFRTSGHKIGSLKWTG